MSTLSFHELTKRYGDVAALDGFTAVAMPGRVTAFVGPNGAGKTTACGSCSAWPSRRPAQRRSTDSATETSPIRRASSGPSSTRASTPTGPPGTTCGSSPGRPGCAPSRADELLHRFGLDGAARRRVGGYSLGMRQRLALASAVIGDPSVLVLDEPLNGLDPDGIREMRRYLRSFADRGGTVFLSSHLLSEVEAVADDLIVISQGRLAAAGSLADLVADTDLESVFHSITHPTHTEQEAWS